MRAHCAFPVAVTLRSQGSDSFPAEGGWGGQGKKTRPEWRKTRQNDAQSLKTGILDGMEPGVHIQVRYRPLDLAAGGAGPHTPHGKR